MQIRRILAPCVALLVVAAPTVMAQRNNNNPQQQQQQKQQRSPQEQRDLDALFFAVDGVASGQAAPTDIPVSWDVNYFIQSTKGQVYVPFVVKVDRSKLASPAVAMYIRLVDKAQAQTPAAPATPPAAPAGREEDKKAATPPPTPTYAWSAIHFADVPADGTIARAVQVPPGEYQMYIAIKERTTDAKVDPKAPPVAVKAGVLQRDLSVPNFQTAGLTTSSVLVANSVEPVNPPLPADQQDDNPLVIGGMMRVTPQPDHKFSKAGELIVMYWVYGAAATSGKPDLQIEYTVFQGEKPIAKAPVDVVNASTLPPNFDINTSQGVNRIQPIPMASFAPGDYRLEIKITDKAAADKTVTQNVNFTVLPV